MMNESGNAAPEKLELEIQAMKDMRVLDPSHSHTQIIHGRIKSP